MKVITLTSLLLLAVAMSTTAASKDSKRTETVPRGVSGAMAGSMTFEPDSSAPLGSFGVRSIFDGSGNLKHLGAATIHMEHTPWPGPEGLVTGGEVTITAANGDQIVGRYEGTTDYPDPSHAIGHADFEISGGTGRFAYASGTIKATVFVTITGGAVWPVTWVLEGTVSY